MTIELPPDPTIIIARPDRIGDVIVTSALIEPLRRRFPKGHLHFLAKKNLEGLFWKHPQLDSFIGLTDAEFRDMESIHQKLEPLHAHVILHFQSAPYLAHAAEDAGIPFRIGWEGTPACTHLVPDLRAAGQRHEAACCFDLLALLNIAPAQPVPALSIDPETSIPPMLEHSIVLHPYSSKPQKAWPVEHWVHLAQMFLREKKHPLVLVGGGKTWPSPKVIDHKFHGIDVIRLDGKLDLPQLATLLKKASLFISVDSGPAHLAAAMGCPTIAIFGRTEPEFCTVRWRPLGHQVRTIQQSLSRKWWEPRGWYWARSFRELSPEMVFRAKDF